jgi:hypothetical protein
MLTVKRGSMGRALVAHACNPSYSGGRDQKDHASKSAMGKQFERPYPRNSQYEEGLEEWLKQ